MTDGHDAGRTTGAPTRAASGSVATPQRGLFTAPSLTGRGISPRVLRSVLSRYDLGAARSIEPILRGGSDSIKLLVTAEHGRYVLKQREGDNPFAVAFTHRVMLSLRRAGIPVPALVGTRDENNSLVQTDGRVYELTRVIDGRACLANEGDARASGAMLARVHGALDDIAPDDDSRHGVEDARVRAAMDSVRTTLGANDDAKRDLDRVQRLDDTARAMPGIAADRAPPGLVHGDWHPGNLLFAHGPVAGDAGDATSPAVIVGVLDLDRCHVGSRDDEVGFAALQHGQTKGDDPSASCADWPAEASLERVHAFLSGYGRSPDGLAGRMVRRLVAEAMTRLAGEGHLGRHPTPAVLRMVATKGEWLLEHAGRIDRLMTRRSGAS